MCGVPDSQFQLLRLTVRPSLAGDETVVVWSGLRREVWQEGRTLFFLFYPKFHGCDYISTSWKLASASLDFASVATVSSRYFLAVRAWPVSVCDSVILTFYQVLDDGNTLTSLLQPPASTTS